MRLFRENSFEVLRIIFISKPPLMIVIVSVFSLAAVYLGTCAYINTHPIRVDNFMKDWNLYLEKLASLHFCIKNKDFLSDLEDLNAKTRLELESENNPMKTSKRLQPISQKSVDGDINLESSTSAPIPALLVPLHSFDEKRRVSVLLQVQIQHPSDLKYIPYNSTSFQADIDVKSLGIAGDTTNILNLSTTLHHSWQPSKCDSSNLLKINCDVTTLYACVTLEGDPQHFPVSQKKPNACTAMTNASDADIQYTVKMDPYKLDKNSIKRCHGNLKLQLKHLHDPRLNVYLTTSEKWIIMRRLIITSVTMVTALVVTLMVMTLTFGVKPVSNEPADKTTNSSQLIEEDEEDEGDEEIFSL